jgi:hypothetical protein
VLFISHLIHRKNGYGLLSGHGLEMGAFHQPAAIPWHCTVEYLDIYPKSLFKNLVIIHHINTMK